LAMKPDLYTKSVLTVIAGSLLWLCVQNAVHPPTVSAQGAQRVIIAGVDDGAVRNLFASLPSGFPVTVGAPLPVDILGPLRSQHLGSLPVRVENRQFNEAVPVSVSNSVLPVTGSVSVNGGLVAIDGPVTVKQALPKVAPPAPSKK